jgi:hypothetical protein
VVGADRAWRAQHPLRYEDSTDTEIKPQYLVQALYEATNDGDCILSTDIGQHQMWAAQYFHFAKPRRWINSGGLGTMGFGLPAAMGAAVGPDVPTVVLTATLDPDEHPGAGTARGYGSRSRSHHNNGYLAWSASGRSCSGTGATPAVEWACPTSSSSPRYGATGVR